MDKIYPRVLTVYTFTQLLRLKTSGPSFAALKGEMLKHKLILFCAVITLNYGALAAPENQNSKATSCNLMGLKPFSRTYISQDFKSELISQIKQLKNTDQITLSLIQGKIQLSLNLRSEAETLHLTLLPIKQSQVGPDYYKKKRGILLSLLSETSQAIQDSHYSKIKISTLMENEIELDLASTEIKTRCTGQFEKTDVLRSRELAAMGIGAPQPTSRLNRWFRRLGNFLKVAQMPQKEVTIFLRTGSINR